MSDAKPTLEEPDFAEGIALSRLADGGMLAGHAHGEPMILVRQGTDLFAVGADLSIS